MNDKVLYELTDPQKSIWMSEEYCKDTCFANICGFLTIHEVIDFNLLKKAINSFIKYNDALCLKFVLDKETANPVQYFDEGFPTSFEMRKFNTIKEAESYAKEYAQIPFELINKFLFDFKLFSLPNGHGGFYAKIHHLISDAWTMSLVINKITKIYSSLKNGETPTFDEPSYIDFINSYSEYINSKKFENSKLYWKDTIYKHFNLTFLKDTTSTIPSYDAKRLSMSFNKSLLKQIKDFCHINKISLYTLFLSALGIYLAKINNKQSCVIGSPVLNRSNYKEKNTVGMFISTVPLILDTSYNYTVKEYMDIVSNAQFGSFRHQKYPYDLILKEVKSKYNISGNMYDVALSYQNAKSDKNSDIDFTSNWTFNGCVVNNLDIHIYDMDDTGIPQLFYDYKTQIFEEREIYDLHSRLEHILTQLITNPSNYLKDIEIVTNKEKQSLIYDFNSITDSFPSNKTIYDLFKEQGLKTPNKLALVKDDVSLTYKELIDLVDRNAVYLFNNGVNKNDKVCLFFNNSIELIISILSVLKLGACYIPIDTRYPKERIEYIIGNSNCSKILTSQNLFNNLSFLNNMVLVIDIAKLTSIDIIKIDDASSFEDLAYIIYTSGSTGKPKGVKILNKTLTNYICFANKHYVNNRVTNFPLYSSVAFDLTVTSIFTPLISGNTIYIYEDENAELLLKSIIDDKKTHIIKLTPAHLSLLQDLDLSDSCIEKLIVGGDNLSSKLCELVTDSFSHPVEIYNEYGPTEATVGCMIYKYKKEDPYNNVPIGYPADNVKLYVLNDNLDILPYQVPGQLYIGGSCLSDGYLGLESLTNSKFIPNPYDIKKSSLYQSGDIVKFSYNNIIQYIGRSDFQVKINGYRIEVEEIQSVLLQYPSIKDCFVHVLISNGHKYICAYCVSDESQDTTKLKHFLQQFLPNYMLPKQFVFLEKLPLTVNGKIDKNLLPLPVLEINKEYVAPKNDMEKLLCDLFCKLLDISQISTEDDFFNYYIDSLGIIKLHTMLHSLGYHINTQLFYEYPTIASLANHMLDSSSVPMEKKKISNFINIPSILKENHVISKNNNILLFGSTGFLGIHILNSLLTTTTHHIYCSIRNKDGENASNRLKKKYSYYFDLEDYFKYEDRIHIIDGNILEKDLGFSSETYQELSSKIDCVINSAALVKHYGDYKFFDDLNVKGTDKIIDFCLKLNLPLHYVSTMSVSGNGLVTTPESSFTENDFYIGQSYLDNVYVRSKFEAENKILHACTEKGLIASIYRVGNITNRYSDGKFQENASDNAFTNRLLAFLNSRMMPKELLNITLEFTPVDFLADTIVKMLSLQEKNLNIFHLYNPTPFLVSTFVEMVCQAGIPIKETTLDIFTNTVLNANNAYFGITNYLENILSPSFNLVTLNNNETISILQKNDIYFPEINQDYIYKLLKFLNHNLLIT